MSIKVNGILYVDVYLDGENQDSVIREILSEVRPEWDSNHSQIENLKVGFLNQVFKCQQNAQDATDAVVVKTTEEYFFGPMKNFDNVYELLNEQNLGPETLAKFRNGIVSDFIEGDSLEWNSPRLKVEQVWKKIAEQFAHWHCRRLYQRGTEVGLRHVRMWVVDKLEKRWPLIMSREPMKSHEDALPTLEDLLGLENYIINRMTAAGELEPALCHNDINGSNVIEMKSGEVCFLDLDFVGLSYTEYELAWYFVSFWDTNDPMLEFYKPAYTKSEKMNFLTHYLQHRKLLDEGVATLPTVDEVSRLYNRVEKANLMTYPRVIVGQAYINDYNGRAPMFIEFAKRLWGQYYQEKQRLFGDDNQHN